MKPLIRTILLWFVLALLSWLLARATADDMTETLAVGALFLLPPLAAWFTVGAVRALPEGWFWRVAFWVVTAGGWLAALLLAQGHCETSLAVQRHDGVWALSITGLAVVWLAVKTRTLPRWRVVREAAAGVAILALAGGVFVWSYDARTRSIAAQSEARWTEIGLPMTEFEKTITPGRENAGSEVARQVLREQVGARFYKDGTVAAAREPAITPSKTTEDIIARAVDLLVAGQPPSDVIEISAQPIAAIEVVAPTLDAAYRSILATEPPAWVVDLHDGYAISVANFLGIRKFSQLIAADALRRLSAGDEEGAVRAIAAGLRVTQSLRHHPTLVSLMIKVAVDGLFTPEQVRLLATQDGWASIARDVPVQRAEFLRRLQSEAWIYLRFAAQSVDDSMFIYASAHGLPGWARHITNGYHYPRQCAIAVGDYAEQAVILRSPATLALSDCGDSRIEAAFASHSSAWRVNSCRAAMRIHATLLLREQCELIRDARGRLAAGRPIESRDSAVLPGVRWELTADAEKRTVATRLAGAPAWIVENTVTGKDFWLLPLDGSVAWQFRASVR